MGKRKGQGPLNKVISPVAAGHFYKWQSAFFILVLLITGTALATTSPAQAQEVSFGSWSIGGHSELQFGGPVSGDKPVTYTQFAIVSGDTATFSISRDGVTGRTFQPGESPFGVLRFAPATLGLHSAVWRIAWTQDDHSASVDLVVSGTGVAQNVLDFGQQPVGIGREFSLGGGTISPGNAVTFAISVTPSGSGFEILEDNHTGRTFLPGEPGPISKFEFKPIAVGPTSAIYRTEWFEGDLNLSVDQVLQGEGINPPSITISKVTASGTGPSIGFGMNSLSFCSSDIIRCEATTTNDAGLTIEWSVRPGISSGVPLSILPNATPNSYDFQLINLPHWVDPDGFYPDYPRPALTFTVIASLKDVASGAVKATSDPVTVTQDDRGRLRQEYVDYDASPIDGEPPVPPVSWFSPFLRTGDIGENTQREFDWAIIDQWADTPLVTTGAIPGAIQQVKALAPTLKVGPIVVNSLYRSPLRNLQVGSDAPGSRHLWGMAVDLNVSDFGGYTEQENYNILANICRYLGFRVQPEGRTNHVHIQKVGPANDSVITIRPVSAASYEHDGGGVTVTINGAGFVPNSVVQLDGVALPTKVISATKITAHLSYAQFGTAAYSNIAVHNPGSIAVANPGAYGGTSNFISGRPLQP